MVLMTSCGDIDLLRDPGPVWEPGFPPIGSYVCVWICMLCYAYLNFRVLSFVRVE
jgi:hypothetical protein